MSFECASAFATILRMARPSSPTASAAHKQKSLESSSFETLGYDSASPLKQSLRIRAHASRFGLGIVATRSHRDVKATSIA